MYNRDPTTLYRKPSGIGRAYVFRLQINFKARPATRRQGPELL